MTLCLHHGLILKNVPDALYIRSHDFLFRLFPLPQLHENWKKFEANETDSGRRRGWTGPEQRDCLWHVWSHIKTPVAAPQLDRMQRKPTVKPPNPFQSLWKKVWNMRVKTWRCPAQTASCSGVTPLHLALVVAPAFRSSSTTVTWPMAAASCSAVQPDKHMASVWTPNTSRISTRCRGTCVVLHVDTDPRLEEHPDFSRVVLPARFVKERLPFAVSLVELTLV